MASSHSASATVAPTAWGDVGRTSVAWADSSSSAASRIGTSGRPPPSPRRRHERPARQPQGLHLQARGGSRVVDDDGLGSGERAPRGDCAEGRQQRPRGIVAVARRGRGQLGETGRGPAPEPPTRQQRGHDRQRPAPVLGRRVAHDGVGQPQGRDRIAAQRRRLGPAGRDGGRRRARGERPFVPAGGQLGRLGQGGVARGHVGGGHGRALGAGGGQVLAGAGGGRTALGQRRRQAGVEPAPVRHGRHLRHGRRDDRHGVPRPRGDEARGVERVDGLAQPVGGEVGGGGQQLVVEVGAGAEGSEDRPGRRCELVHFGPQRRHQRGRGRTGLGREPPAGHDPVGRPRRQGQADQRGHAAAVVVEGVDQPVVDGGAEHDGGELADLGLLQRPEGDERLGSAEQRVERRQRGVAGRRPVGDHQGDALGRRPFGHADDHPERPGVEPLGVVDDEGGGAARRSGGRAARPGSGARRRRPDRSAGRARPRRRGRAPGAGRTGAGRRHRGRRSGRRRRPRSRARRTSHRPRCRSASPPRRRARRGTPHAPRGTADGQASGAAW